MALGPRAIGPVASSAELSPLECAAQCGSVCRERRGELGAVWVLPQQQWAGGGARRAGCCVCLSKVFLQSISNVSVLFCGRQIAAINNNANDL